MRDRATALAVALGMALAAAACSGGAEKNVVNQYFTAVRANDTEHPHQLRHGAVRQADRGLEDRLGRTRDATARAAARARQEAEGPRGRARQEQARGAEAGPTTSAIYQKRRAAGRDPGEGRQASRPRSCRSSRSTTPTRRPTASSRRSVAAAKAEVEREKRNATLSVGQIEDIETLTGEMITKDVELLLTTGGQKTPYVMTLRKYELTGGTGPRMVSRWVVQSLTPKALAAPSTADPPGYAARLARACALRAAPLARRPAAGAQTSSRPAKRATSFLAPTAGNDTVTLRSSPSPSRRSTVPTPKSGWRTLTPGRSSAAAGRRRRGRRWLGARTSGSGRVAAGGCGRQPGATCASAAALLHRLERDLVQEAARLADATLAEDLAAARPGQVQPVLGPRHADVAEPALLLEALLVREAARVRQQPLLEPDQEHRLELEALGGVQRHQQHRDLVAQAIGLRDERRAVQEARRGSRPPRGPRSPPRPPAARRGSRAGPGSRGSRRARAPPRSRSPRACARRGA